MKNITLVLGGARSGKSTFAEKLALAQHAPVTYLATADCRDGEMAKRVELHQLRRPAHWGTWEGEPSDLPSAIEKLSGFLLLDCLTMWLTRLYLASPEAEIEDEEAWLAAEKKITGLTERLCSSLRDDASLVAVSNEVGFGLVPPYLMGRRFRDLQVRINQLVAARAEKVVLVVAGCPLWVKGEIKTESDQK